MSKKIDSVDVLIFISEIRDKLELLVYDNDINDSIVEFMVDPLNEVLKENGVGLYSDEDDI